MSEQLDPWWPPGARARHWEAQANEANYRLDRMRSHRKMAERERAVWQVVAILLGVMVSFGPPQPWPGVTLFVCASMLLLTMWARSRFDRRMKGSD